MADERTPSPLARLVSAAHRLLQREDPARFWREVAQRLYERGRAREALRSLSVARTIDGRPAALEGLALIRIGWPERAWDVFESSVRNDPRDLDALAGLALLEHSTRGVPGSIERLRRMNDAEEADGLAPDADLWTPDCRFESVASFLRGTALHPAAHLLHCPNCRRDAVERWDAASEGRSECHLGATLRAHDAPLRRGDPVPVLFGNGSRARLRRLGPSQIAVDELTPVEGFEEPCVTLAVDGTPVPMRSMPGGTAWTAELPEGRHGSIVLLLSLRPGIPQHHYHPLDETPKELRRRGSGAIEILTRGGAVVAGSAADGGFSLPPAVGADGIERFWRLGEGTFVETGGNGRGAFRLLPRPGGARLEGPFPPCGEFRLEYGTEPFPDVEREREALRRALVELGESEAAGALGDGTGGPVAVVAPERWREFEIDGAAIHRALAAETPFRADLPDLGALEVARGAGGAVAVGISLGRTVDGTLILVLGTRWIVLDKDRPDRASRAGIDAGWFAGVRLAIRERTRPEARSPEARESDVFVGETIRFARTGAASKHGGGLEITKGDSDRRLGTLFLLSGLRPEPGADCEVEFRFGESFGRAALEPDPRSLYRLRLPVEPARALPESGVEARWRGSVLRGFVAEGFLHLEFPPAELPARAELEIFAVGE